MADLKPEEARIVRAVSEIIANEQVAHARRALCDVLGVLVAHVITGAPAGSDSGELLAISSDLIRDEVLASYFDFIEWKNRQLS